MPNQHFESFGEACKRVPEIVFRRRLDPEAKVFVKSAPQDVFTSEAAGLDALRKCDSIRIAEVLGVGTSKGQHLLVLEAIESHPPKGDFFERFGRQLAALHRNGQQSETFGFEQDNFLGPTQQANAWRADWVEFWAEQRLGFQLKLAKENGYGGNTLQQLGAGVLARLDSLIGASPEQPVLIHGDLWSGNWLCDELQQPALIDPAAYYANREAEFGMTTLFGGLPQTFYDAYNEAWPLQTGWRERVAVYRLYHLLNHLNLFGVSYLRECLELMRQFQ